MRVECGVIEKLHFPFSSEGRSFCDEQKSQEVTKAENSKYKVRHEHNHSPVSAPPARTHLVPTPMKNILPCVLFCNEKIPKSSSLPLVTSARSLKFSLEFPGREIHVGRSVRKDRGTAIQTEQRTPQRKNTRSQERRNGKSLPSIPEFSAADESAGEKTIDQTAEISSCSVASWTGSTGEPVDLVGGERREAHSPAGGCDARCHQRISPSFRRLPSMATPIVSTRAPFSAIPRTTDDVKAANVTSCALFLFPAAPSLVTARGNGGAYLRAKRVAQAAGGIIRTG